MKAVKANDLGDKRIQKLLHEGLKARLAETQQQAGRLERGASAAPPLPFTWRIKAIDAQGLRDELATHYKEDRRLVGKLFRIFDLGGDGKRTA